MIKKAVKRKINKNNAITELLKAHKLIFAPLTFQAIASLLDLGILKQISIKPSSLNDLTTELNLDEYTVKTLLQVAEVSNIVEYKNGKYIITKCGDMFLYDDMAIANFNFVKDVCYLGASELTESFKTKCPKGLHKFIGNYDTIYPALSTLPKNIQQSWFAFDHLYSDNCFQQVFDIIIKKHNVIFDIGGNTGKFERVCLQNPNCKISMLDLPENISTIINKKELIGCNFYPINVLDKNPKYPSFGDSAIFMSQFLDCFSKEQILKILTDIKNQMNDNSTVYILEPFTDNQNFEAAKLSLVHTSLYFTCMANGVSKMYEEKEFLELINSAGLNLKMKYSNIGDFDYTLLECTK